MKKKLLKDEQGFALSDLKGIVLTLVVIGVLFGAGLYVMTEFRKQIDDGNATWMGNETTAAINHTIGGLSNLATWIPIIVVVIAAALVIGIVIRSFSGGGVY